MDRALLTFEGGSHNTVAPIPAPEEAFTRRGVGSLHRSGLGHGVHERCRAALRDGMARRHPQGGTTARPPISTCRGSARTGGPASPLARRTGLRYETLAAGQVPAPIPVPASVWLLGLALGGLTAVRRRRG